MKNYIKIMPLLCALLVSSCVRDRVDTPKAESSQSEETRLAFSLQMPASLSTMAATDQENLVKNIYVLAFRVGENGKEYYDYKALASSIQDRDVTSTRYKKMIVTVLKKDYDQRFVLIANAFRQVEDIDPQQGELKEDLLAKLEFENTAKWHATEASDFVPFPMWGETENTVLVNDGNTNTGLIKMTRMVSRIDVVLATDEAEDAFELSEVHLYNYNTKGRIVPDVTTEYWDETLYKAKKTTLPAGGPAKQDGAHIINAVTSGTTTLMPSIYTFESPLPEDNKASDATCIVVGGKYDGSDKISYYRLDFFNKDQEGNILGYKELLRNHAYRVNIVAVDGGGYTDPDEAFESKSINMEAEVKEWDQGDITDVVFDRQYMLGVSQTEFKVSRKQSSDNLLYVTTDVPAGWKIDWDKDKYPWLGPFVGSFSDVDQKDPVTFSVTENKGAEREGYFTVSAGRLSITVKVTQGVYEDNSLTIKNTQYQEISQLLFTAYGSERTSESQKFTVEWNPTDEDCYITMATLTNPAFDCSAGNDPASDVFISGGIKSYTMKPVAFTDAEVDAAIGKPFLEKKSQLTFMVGEGDDFKAKPLLLRHIHYDFLPEVEDTYELDGTRQSFTFDTNADWKVTNIGGNKSIITLLSTEGTSGSGQVMYFDTVDDEDGNISERVVEITFTYTGEDGRSATKLVTVNFAAARNIRESWGANSYILLPDGDGIDVPLSWANKDGETRIGINDKVEAKVIWIDNANGVGKSNSTISGYYITGDGSEGHLVVLPGKPGNALIGVYVNNKIRWSWHIWVTEYDPEAPGSTFNTSDGYTWMTYNLGAQSNTPGRDECFGFTYQWGRKDPMPPLGSHGTLQPVPVYKENGDLKTIDIYKYTVGHNLEYSIEHPDVFICGPDSNYSDWLTDNFSGDNRFMWCDGDLAKAHYDPCPDGWRVPYNVKSVYDGFTQNFGSATWSAANYGTSFTLAGWWPAAGYRDGGTGDYTSTYSDNSVGLYWSSRIEEWDRDARGIGLKPSNGSPVEHNLATKRSHAFNVRCVKDNRN